jgi:hypothetical protein
MAGAGRRLFASQRTVDDEKLHRRRTLPLTRLEAVKGIAATACKNNLRVVSFGLLKTKCGVVEGTGMRKSTANLMMRWWRDGITVGCGGWQYLKGDVGWYR